MQARGIIVAMLSDVSVVILTKNRDKLLALCLASLVQQTVQPDEVIIIDNYSKDNTRQVCRYFSSMLPITTFHTGIKGFPALYNFGISKTRCEYVSLINDDCFANKHWIENIKKQIERFPTAVLQGFAQSIPKKNIYAAIMADHYRNWLLTHLSADYQMDVIDNKNVVIPKKILGRTKLYDENLTDGAEDIALGKQLVSAKVPIIFQPNIIVYHRERTTLAGFIQQHIRIAHSERILDDKLEPEEKIGMIFNKKNLLNFYSFIDREVLYLSKLQFFEFVYTPFLYAVLFGIRTWNYAKQKN